MNVLSLFLLRHLPTSIPHNVTTNPHCSPGPYGCIGKELAKMELRTVVPLLVSRFDVSLAPGEDGTRLLDKSRDAFTMRLEELRLIFEERERG